MEKEVGGGVPLLIRWTTDFDCPEKTEWWYCIKDTPFDINSLKSKRRYEINKGKKNFYVKEINPLDFKEEIYKIQKEAFSVYPIKYRPRVEKEKVYTDIEKNWNKYKVYGSFLYEKDKLCGYALLEEYDEYMTFKALKVEPEYEKKGINAAIVAFILERYNFKLGNNFYICDGERNILHETFFQEYLEKYFGFRKAYCKLNIKYRFWMKILINILCPFSKILKNIDKNIVLHKINALLYMEKLRKSF